MKVEKGDKGLLAFAPVVGVAALAVLAVPLLPVLFAANPDQVSARARSMRAARPIASRLPPVATSHTDRYSAISTGLSWRS